MHTFINTVLCTVKYLPGDHCGVYKVGIMNEVRTGREIRFEFHTSCNTLVSDQGELHYGSNRTDFLRPGSYVMVEFQASGHFNVAVRWTHLNDYERALAKQKAIRATRALAQVKPAPAVTIPTNQNRDRRFVTRIAA